MVSGGDQKSGRKGVNRRQFLCAGGLAMFGSGLLPLVGSAAAQAQSVNYSIDGSTDPFPIPWLDKNGSHNQSPGPNMEPSNIYHFSGQVARANDFKGMGTDNAGNRIAFGAPSTDFSCLAGKYFAGRQERQAIFSHL